MTANTGKIMFLMAVVISLQLMPLACGQNEYGYASYSLTRYDAYHQELHLIVEAPGNESEVATNQALPLRVMPIDLDKSNETLIMYVDGIEYYEFKDEDYYKMPVVVTAPLNSTFTIEFKVKNHTLLALDYPVLLTSPSMSDDYTALFEELMRERERERMEESYITFPKGYEKVLTAEVILTTLAISVIGIVLAAAIKKKSLLISTANGINIFIFMFAMIIGLLYIGLRVAPYLSEEMDLPTIYMVLIDFVIGLLYTVAFVGPYLIAYFVINLSNKKVLHETELKDKNINLIDTVIYTNRKGKKCIAKQDVCSALRRLAGRHVLVDANGSLHGDWTLNNENELLLVDKIEAINTDTTKTDETGREDAHQSFLTPVLSRLGMDTHPPAGEVFKIDLAQVHFVDSFEFVHDVEVFLKLKDKIDRLVEAAHVYKHNMHALADTLASRIMERIWGTGPEEDIGKTWAGVDGIDSIILQSSKEANT